MLILAAVQRLLWWGSSGEWESDTRQRQALNYGAQRSSACLRLQKYQRNLFQGKSEVVGTLHFMITLHSLSITLLFFFFLVPVPLHSPCSCLKSWPPMAIHSSTLAWKIPWGRKESDTSERLHVHVLLLTGSLLLFLHISAETSPS